MACSCFGIWVALRVSEVVAMLPRRRDRIESVQVVEAESMRPTSTKQKEFVVDVAQLHSSSWRWTLTHDNNLGPQEFLETENKEIIEPLRAIPTTEYVEVMLDYTRTVVGSWRWSHSSNVLNVSPMKGRSIELVQIVQVVTTIASTEYVNFILVAVSGMHVARTRWLASKFVVEPFKLLQIEDVHIVSSKWPLTKPSTNDVQAISDQSGGVAVPSLRRSATRLYRFLPAVFFSVKYSQVAMVFLAVITSEDVQLLVEQRSSVVLDLWS
jgi:hypothetical protein